MQANTKPATANSIESKMKSLFTVCGGDLFRKSDNRTIRHKYEWHFRRPKNAQQVAACLRAGPRAWPGGYPIFFIMLDGSAMCFDCVRKEFKRIVSDYIGGYDTGWQVDGCNVNWEDTDCVCCHCNKVIPSAYGE